MEKKKTNIRLSEKVYSELEHYRDNNGLKTFSDTVKILLTSNSQLTELIDLVKKNQQLLKDSQCNGCQFKNKKKNKKLN